MAVQTGVILVVDDDRINRVVLTNQLEIEGHTVFAAEHGRQAIDLLHTHNFDVVLLDLVMPEMDGFQVLEYIRNTEALNHLPVIVISAIDEMGSVVRSIQMGATDHLIKPCDPFLLRARIMTSLSAKQLRDKEAEYLRQVAHLTSAAFDLEAGMFDPESLDTVAARPDALGHLARVFQHMAGEVRAREQLLQQQNDFRSALLGKITHELRSPFVSAAFAAQVLQRYVEHEMYTNLPEQIHILQRQLAEGCQSIDRIITSASLLGKQAELRREPTNLAQLIPNVIAPLKQLAVTRDIVLSSDIAQSLPVMMLDPGQIGEAIYHLVHNAIKFNRERGRVYISCHVIGQELVFIVEDTGKGIDLQLLPKLWDAFAQTADDVRRGVEGLGLGLTLVRRIVEAHGGTPFAHSAPGVGSSFGFRLPLV